MAAMMEIGMQKDGRINQSKQSTKGARRVMNVLGKKKSR